MESALLSLSVAVGLNTLSVALQSHRQFLTRLFGTRAFAVHRVVVLPPWAAFVVVMARLPAAYPPQLPSWNRRVGALLMMAAATLWGVVYRHIGGKRVMNGNFFEPDLATPVTSGVYRWRENPMYDSYVLAMLAAALWRRSRSQLLIPALGVALLHGLEAWVENQPIRAARARRGAPAGEDDVPAATRAQ